MGARQETERGEKGRKKTRESSRRHRRRRVVRRGTSVPGTPRRCPTQPRRPCRGREPINTSARARGAADAAERDRARPNTAERGRTRPSPGTRRIEFPTASGVAGSVVVQEWSPRDVWYRNRECDRGIKGTGVVVFARVPFLLSLSFSLSHLCLALARISQSPSSSRRSSSFLGPTLRALARFSRYTDPRGSCALLHYLLYKGL